MTVDEVSFYVDAVRVARNVYKEKRQYERVAQEALDRSQLSRRLVMAAIEIEDAYDAMKRAEAVALAHGIIVVWE
jgi:precorrin-6B methylase 2